MIALRDDYSVRSFPVEWQAYDGKWRKLFSVTHADLSGAAEFAGTRIREIVAAGVPVPSRVVLRVWDGRTDNAAFAVG